MRRFLSEKLSPSLKLTLKRAAYAPVRLAARVYDFVGRAHPSAGAEHARTVRAASGESATQVIVFDDHIPTPDRDAGSARMAFILKSLAEWCHPVFVSTSKQALPEYERLLWKEGVETVGLLDSFRLLKRRGFAAAIMSRPAVAEMLLKSVRRADPNIRIVFDMVDVHFIRFGREHELTGDAGAARASERYRKVETRLARASDLVWCASTADRDAMSREVPGASFVVVPTIHHAHEPGLPFDERRDLLFVGNFSHRPNADGVSFFAREVFPAVRESIPDAQLLVVGDNAPPEVAALASDPAAGVRLLGYVPDLAPLFAASRVFVAPLRFGAGAKGKIGEALSYGIPVVTTTIGAEGMGFRAGEHLLIEDEPRDFAEAVVRVYRDAALWQSLADKGRRHVAEHFGPQPVGELINDSIKKLIGNQHQNRER